MSTWRRKWLGVAVLVFGGIALLSAVGARAAPINEEFRWDIVKDSSVIDIIPGGEASALASDGSKITVTGSGTFIPSSGFATGGGNWVTRDGKGVVTGAGSYAVTAFVTFAQAPGKLLLPAGAIDFIAPAHTARAGFVVLRIAYSDGTEGVLVFSCMLLGTPESVLEGVTASKGFTDYWNSVIAPVTIFHVQ
jgi:hypothetical protein